MSDKHLPQTRPSAPEPTPKNRPVFCLRRRSLAEWLAWLLWLMTLIIVLEYSLTSFREHERQAGILAGAMFIGLLLAGIIIEVIKNVEIYSPYHDLSDQPPEES
jgi:hypothetical protein